jgi:hypothetical protein
MYCAETGEEFMRNSALLLKLQYRLLNEYDPFVQFSSNSHVKMMNSSSLSSIAPSSKRFKSTTSAEAAATSVVHVPSYYTPTSTCYLDTLDVDLVAHIQAYLTIEELMRSRIACKKFRVASSLAVLPPPSGLIVDSTRKYYGLVAMRDALPNLQQVSLRGFGGRGQKKFRFSHGMEADNWHATVSSNYTTHDISILSNFTKLQNLTLTESPMNGRYPFLFNFQHLQKLRLVNCNYLKWDLDMIEGLPVLKELNVFYSFHNRMVTGNISSLRVRKDTLEVVRLGGCIMVEGNLMDLADFPVLNSLNLNYTAVTGDLRDIHDHHFVKLQELILPSSVYGGGGQTFQRIADVPDSDVMRAIYQLRKRDIQMYQYARWSLSDTSPDWYSWEDRLNPQPPFLLSFVKAGPRMGWRWKNFHGDMCEINWIDPKPELGTENYSSYVQDLVYITRKSDFYKGYHQPPTEEEYKELCRRRRHGSFIHHSNW